MHNKRPAWNKNHAGLFVSHEAFRRMAACTRQLAGNPARPASRGTFRATAVKPRPTFTCPSTPLRGGAAQSGVKGHCPLREPWHLPCHGGKTPANFHVPLRPCAAEPRSPGCRGSAPARPASREACRRAAVKPRPSRMSHEHPARRRRAVRLKALPYSSSKAPV